MKRNLTGILLAFATLLLAHYGRMDDAVGADEASAGNQKLDEQSAKPIRVLLITGGCCHDYPFQTAAMQKAAVDRGVAMEWKVVNEGGTGTEATIDLYKDPDWAKDFDVVIHNECFANTKEEAYIQSITNVHKAGANAVVIHCAMHTYRAAKIDDWRELLGVTSRKHEHKSEYVVRNAKPEHPAMKDFPQEWTTPSDELYVIEKVWPDTEVLATSISEKTEEMHPVIWAHKYGKARVFGTTFGHSNETFEDKVFLDTVINGIQWSAGRL